MGVQDYIWLNMRGNVELLQAKGYRYIIPGEEHRQNAFPGMQGCQDIIFVEAVPVVDMPGSGVSYLRLTKDGIDDIAYSYIVHPKYFD